MRALLLLLLVSGPALAQVPDQLAQTTTTIAVDAHAIRDSSLPMFALREHAIRVRDLVATLPALTPGANTLLKDSQVRLRQLAAQLVEAAEAQDRSRADDLAEELVDELDRFQSLSGL